MVEQEDNVESLRVVQRPRAEEKIQREIAGHLARLTAMNQEGELDCLFIIASHPDGTYSEAISSTINFRQMIGQVEVVKANWIGMYLASLSGKPGGAGK